MERSIQKNGLINLFVLLTVTLATFAVARYANSLAGQVASAFLGLGVLVAMVSWFQMRLEDRERLEKLEFDEVSSSRTGGAGLFETAEVENFPARHSREQFERFFVPGFTVFLFLLELACGWLLWNWLRNLPAALPLRQPLVAMAIVGLLALLLFLIGKYSGNLARLENQRFLRPGAGFMLFDAYLLTLVIGSIVAVKADFLNTDLHLAFAMCGFLVVLAGENLVTLLLELYRPRLKGKQARILYESRLIGLLSHPEDAFTTAAHALDYQFGFKISETWFFRFVQRAFLGLVLIQLGILLLSSCFVFVNAGQQVLLERFGVPVNGRPVLGPGLHPKLPWPIDKTYRYTNEAIQSFNIGFEHDEDEEEKTVLWTIAHYKQEFHLLVASREPVDTTTNNVGGKKNPPVSLLSVGIPVQYQITNLTDWAYNFRNADELLERIGTREVVRYLVSVDMDELMSRGRFAAGEELRRRIQAAADEMKIGAKIVFVGLQDVHPPVQVAAAFENVVGARQKRLANLNMAEAHKIRTNAQATALSYKHKREAEADRSLIEADALARASLFTNQIAAYRASPAVYSERSYLQALVRGGTGARKYILSTTNTLDMLHLNLEEKGYQPLLGVPLPEAKAK